jgi:chloramphenicol-sensitive protein RarD
MAGFIYYRTFMNNTKHYVSAISAFVIWGFFSVPLRALKAFSVGEILYFRILFSCIVLLVLLFGFRKHHMVMEMEKFRELSGSQKTKVLGLTFGGALLLTINWLIFIYTVNHVNIKTASFSYFICPVITAILGFLLLKEKLTGLQWMAVALCALSCVLMGLNSVNELGYSFFTAFTYALYLVTQRQHQNADRLLILGIQVLFSFLVLNVFFTYLVVSIPSTPSFYTIVAIIAVIFTVLPLFLNLYALNKINSATIGILMYINPVINFLIAIFVFGEEISQLQWLGYLMILVALIIFNFANVKRMYGRVA